MASYHDADDDSLEYIPDPSRPHSIDLSLELERQLEIDSLPNSPAAPRFSINRPQSLDPHVLASIVTQLRLQVVELTRERDEFQQLATEVQAREASLKDALHTVSERCLGLEKELADVTEKSKDDQDAVTMLRGKLEDSRRALMRLQTENRRTSQISNMTIDLSRAGPSAGNGPPSSRRSSFAPLTGSPGRANSHRRIASVTEPGVYADQWVSPPTTSRLEPLTLLGSPVPQSQNPRRSSGFFGRGTPILDLPTTTDAPEIEELRKELQAVKEQLEETRHELTETREAQEASETCAKALRTFIADNSIGMGPPGTQATGARNVHSAPPATSIEDHNRNNSVSSRWGFKLWGTPATTPASSPGMPPAPAPAALAGAPPLSRKIGGFFTSRSSISSTSSVTRPDPHSHQAEPICNGSDSSSVDSGTEPVSPASEMPPVSVMVHSIDIPSTLTDSPEQVKKHLELVEPAGLDNRVAVM